MISAIKSPNMLAMTGRLPVIAPPTPSPVIPASEMGLSITRAGPNSSTRPESTLKGVPASATSSPMMNTLGSRRISSAKASRIAWLNVISRIIWPTCWLAVLLSIDILFHLVQLRIGRVQGKGLARLNFGLYSLLDPRKCPAIGQLLLKQPVRQELQGIAVCFPVFFFRAGTVVRALDIANVVSQITIGLTEYKGWSLTLARARHQALRQSIDRANILAIHLLGMHAESAGPGAHAAGSGLGVMGVFVILIVLTDVDHGEFPERGHIHKLVQHPLPKRAVAKEANRHLG